MLALVQGCSFSLDGPREGIAIGEQPDCDTSKAFVALDGVWVGVLSVAALSAFGGGESEVGAISLATAGLFTVAAVSGNGKVDRCRAARGAHERYLASSLESEGRRGRINDGMPRDGAAMQPQLPAPRLPSQPQLVPPQVAPQPAPPQQPPVQQPGTRPAPPAPAAPPAREDEWSDFWQEVP